MENSGVSSDAKGAKDDSNYASSGKPSNQSLIRSNIYGWLAHSELTSAKNPSARKMRPNLTPRAPKSRSKEFLDDIEPIRSTNARAASASNTSSIRFVDSITLDANAIDSLSDEPTAKKRSSISTFTNGYALIRATRGSSNTNSQIITQQRPSISIISNSSHDQNMSKPSDASNDNENFDFASSPTVVHSKAKKSKRRNRVSLSSSLRRLITTISFNRNHASSSTASSDINSDSNSSIGMQADAQALSNYDTNSTNKIRDKKSINKQSSNDKKKNQTTATTASNPTRLQLNNDFSEMLLARTNKFENTSNVDRRLSQGRGPTSQATDDVIIANRRKTIGDTESLREKLVPQEIPPWKAPENADIAAEIDGKTYIECPLCVLLISEASTPKLEGCRHRVCLECMQRYITTEINHSRLNITCPICSEPIHPNAIKQILQNEKLYLKYETFMLRRVLAAEPDARWCPAPDCSYVVLASGCASCPKLVCGREGCNTSFCYHCKQEWHPNQTCSAAGIQRNKRLTSSYNIIEESSLQSSTQRKTSRSSQKGSTIRADDIKECPVCASRIIKMNDGSCNHMTCSICETEFCWLCMKEISDLHYFSPSGCTFWGKKPWSRKKKILWQLGMLAGAPICILLIAGIAVPAIVVGIPVWAARKLHNRLERKQFKGFKRNAIITSGVVLSLMVSPFITAVALAIGIPFLLGYVYGVVPLSLCRSSGGCLSSTNSFEDLQREYQIAKNRNIMARDGISIDTATSHKLGDPSIGETSLYMSNASLETNSIGHVTTVERDDRESASNAGLAGSILSNIVEDGNSTRALAGSIISKDSGYTLIPAEVHSSGQVTSSNSIKTTSPEAASNQPRSKSENK